MSPIIARQRGFSLVELLVSVAIGLVVTLAVCGVLIASEGRKRTAVSTNDAGQSGAYTAYVLDRAVRNAGTGFAQGWSKVGGCRLDAKLRAGETWPRTAALPDPFAAIPQTLRLAPIVIFQNASAAGSDVIMVMSGAAGFGESPGELLPRTPTDESANQWRMNNTIGFRGGDLIMLAGDTASGRECLLTQVATGFTGGASQALPFDTAGDYYATSAGATSMTALNVASASAFAIGNIADNLPQFRLFGVGDNSTLFSHDLFLLNGSNTAQPIAEGVRELHAVYGIDTNDDGIRDDWQAPTAGSGWDGATLMDGSATSATRLRQIVAVRVALVMRSSLIEKTKVAPDSLALFQDLPPAVQATVDLTRTSENQNQRYRTIEFTVPVRNLLLRS